MGIEFGGGTAYSVCYAAGLVGRTLFLLISRVFHFVRCGVGNVVDTVFTGRIVTVATPIAIVFVFGSTGSNILFVHDLLYSLGKIGFCFV